MALALGQAANMLLYLFHHHPLSQTLVMVLFLNNLINFCWCCLILPRLNVFCLLLSMLDGMLIEVKQTLKTMQRS